MEDMQIVVTDVTQGEYLLIIDGSSLLTTQFYGNLPKEIMFAKTMEEKEQYFNRIMQTTQGTYTNAIYGFLRVLLKILKEQHPTYLAVAWDLSRNTFRREIYKEYKGNRGETLVPLKEQFILCQQLLRDMNVPQFMDERYEADDFSGTLAALLEDKVPIRIMTKDNDYLQLVTEQTNIWMIHGTSQKTEELYQKYHINQKKANTPDRTFPFTPELVKAEFGVEPESINSLKGLQGDASDNIKGVPGVGETTAAVLIGKYKTVEALYDAIRGLDESERKKLAAEWKTELGLKRSPMNYLLKTSETELVGESAAILSKQLATIKRDIPLPDLTLDSLQLSLDQEKAKEWFQKLEFKSLKFPEEEEEWTPVSENPFEDSTMEHPFLEGSNPKNGLEDFMNPPVRENTVLSREKKEQKKKELTTFLLHKECRLAFTKEEAEECWTMLHHCPKRAETDNSKAVFAISVLSDTEGFYGLSVGSYTGEFCYFAVNTELTEHYLDQKLSELLTPSIPAACYQLKELYPLLPSLYGKQRLFDVKIAAYLLNPLAGSYLLSELTEPYPEYFKKDTAADSGFAGAAFSYLQPNEAGQAACKSCCIIGGLAELYTDELKEQGMLSLFEQIEMPLTETLYDMQQRGIRAERQALKEYGDQLAKSIYSLEQEIYSLAGEEFNLNSPKQLGPILFDKLKLPNGKKTKTGYSTSADVLERIAEEHPIVPKILEYRQLAKLKSTYADGLAVFIGTDERIHGKFHQTVTATGRISSTDPNLQNIPIRLPLGRQIRKVFVPEEEFVFLDADYSQIELRVLAHMSGDARLTAAYRTAQDIHRITASEVFHTPLEDVTDAQRSNAKAVNFGIVYGISSFGLGQGLNISRHEAEEYIEKYFETYPRVKKFLEELIQNGKEYGYVTTMFGRRRPVPDLTNSNFQRRSAEERIAMNSPVQGTAADIIKIAMIRVNERLKREQLKSRLLLQIHDELLVETHQTEIEQVKQIMKEEMQQAANLTVPLEVEVKQGVNWFEAK